MRDAIGAFFLCIAIFFFAVSNSGAVNPDEILENPVLENRARALSAKIRCVVCQNQSIDDSDAELARDLRVLVREKLTEGLSDQEVLDYLVERYGEFVLLKPPFGLHTLALWVLPFIALLLGLFAMRSLFKRKPDEAPEVTALTAQEKAELKKLTNQQ